MSYGTLGKSIPTANTLMTAYTISANCLLAEINIAVVNSTAGIATVDIAISTSATPSANEYIAKNYPVEALTGFLEINDQLAFPGELIVIRSDKADTIFRVSGKELTTVSS